MAGENDRRDKALESIARELEKSNRLLEMIERNTRPTKVDVEHPYFEKSDIPISKGLQDDGTDTG
jgi:hypothetical protein